jgi:hypothetical protein
MKKSAYFLSLLLFAMAILIGCGSKDGGKPGEKGESGDPKAYNDKLIGIQNTIIKEFIALSNTFSGADKAAIDAAYAKAVKVTGEAVEAIKKEGPYEGDDTFRQKLQALLEFYKSIVEKEYKDMIAIISKGQAITPEDMTKLQELQKSISERETKFDSEMQAAQSAFASKHGVQLKANELQQDIDKMSK